MLKIKRDNPSYVLSADVPTDYKAVSGDIVEFETFDCFENQIKSEDYKFGSLDWERINPVSGPLYVKGTNVGDTLAVDILSIEIDNQIAMVTGPNMGTLGDELKENTVRVFKIEDDNIIMDNFKIPLRKMIGVIGTAPKGKAVLSGVPDLHGGNMDCTEVTEGATLYLPVNVEGALLFIGDLHGAMGDGEVAVCGGEVAGKVQVRVRVIKDISLPLPSIVSKDKIITISSQDTLDEAAVEATKNMSVILESAFGLKKADAVMLMSLVANLKVCQIVDPKLTMRMEISRKYFDNKNPFEL